MRTAWTIALAGLVVASPGFAAPDDVVATIVEGVRAREAAIRTARGRLIYAAFTSAGELSHLAEAVRDQAAATGLGPGELNVPQGTAAAAIRFAVGEGEAYYEAVSLRPGANNAPELPVTGPPGARFVLAESGDARRSCFYPPSPEWPQARVEPGSWPTPATWQPLARLLMLAERVYAFGQYLGLFVSREAFGQDQYGQRIVADHPEASVGLACAGPEEIDGLSCLVATATLRMAGWHSELVAWVCPDMGYCVARAEERVRERLGAEGPDRLRRWVAEGTQWEEVTAGIWLPRNLSLSEYDYSRPDPWVTTRVLFVTDIQVNTLGEEEGLHLEFPLGAMVKDRLADRDYQVGGVDDEATRLRDLPEPDAAARMLEPPSLPSPPAEQP